MSSEKARIVGYPFEYDTNRVGGPALERLPETAADSGRDEISTTHLRERARARVKMTSPDAASRRACPETIKRDAAFYLRWCGDVR